MHAYTHIHTYTHMSQPAASVFADVYVGVKTHLCNIHTCPCTSAQNTCKVHATLTAKKCTYTYTHTHMYTHTYAHENTCACMTPSTRWSTDTETHTHTHIHIYTHTHTKCEYERTHARLERRRGSERARSRCRRRKLCTSLSFDATKPYFAPPMQGLHCTHFLKHQYPSTPHPHRIHISAIFPPFSHFVLWPTTVPRNSGRDNATDIMICHLHIDRDSLHQNL